MIEIEPKSVSIVDILYAMIKFSEFINMFSIDNFLFRYTLR